MRKILLIIPAFALIGLIILTTLPREEIEAYYFDATLGDSPRSKPVEEVVKLWYGIY